MATRPRFKTKIVRSRARFVVKPLSAQQMINVAEPVKEDIKQRILRAETVNDTPAPPLKEKVPGKGYPTYKARRAPPAIRNWRLTGRTLHEMRVLSAGPNRAVIGFSSPVANLRAYINNRRSRQFGVSPRNEQTLIQKYREQRAGVQAQQVA